MLVLTRKQQEKIRIGDNIVITVLRTKGKAVRLGIEAPSEIPVIRGELIFDESAYEAGTNDGISRHASATHAVDLNTSAEKCHDAKKDSAPALHFDRIPRGQHGAVIPQLVTEGGPLRAMLDSRVVAR